MGSKRGVYIVVTVIIALLISTLWVYDSFISPKSKEVKLGNEEKLLQAYIEETIRPDYMPAQLSVQKKLLSDGTFGGVNYTYGAIWNVDGTEAYSFLDYTNDLTALSDIGLWIQFNRTEELDEERASALLNKYLKGKHVLKCENQTDLIVMCEDFSEGKSVESGAGVFVLPNYNYTVVFSCKHFKAGNLFGSLSCLKRG